MSTRKAIAENGIGFVDAGVSGGIWGLTEGLRLMVGGSDADVARVNADFRHACARWVPVEDGFVHAARWVPVTTPRWCTTASSTGLMTA